MSYQNISAEISAKDLEAVKDAIDTIRDKLPFLITLTTEERRKLFKMGDKSLAFVTNSLMVAKNNPQILPPSFKVDEFTKDVDLAVALNEIDSALQQICSQVDDTLLAVGSEAINYGTEVYDYVKTAARKTPGLKPVAEQLGARFVKNAVNNKKTLPKAA